MSGSGGGPWKVDPKEVAQKTRKEEKKALDDDYETKVNEVLAQNLTEYNNRDVEKIKSILDNIISNLGDEVEGAIDLLFGGSVSKHTYIEGLSDIDALVIFNDTELANRSPAELRDILGKITKELYESENVSVGNLAVTVKTDGQVIQLLPTLRVDDGFKISSKNGKEWSSIQPQRFSESLIELNKKNGGKIIPTIKLAKAIIYTLPSQQQLSGYHVESLAVQVFKNYNGPTTPKVMLEYFFENAGNVVKKPIKDVTGQSSHVDDYLGLENSPQRRIVSLALNRISRRMKNADGMLSVEEWNPLFG
jgi:Second Messenger Oligonucleotide or Dinucleotide Synthetase domain